MAYSRYLLLPVFWLLAGTAPANTADANTSPSNTSQADDVQPARVVELFTSQGCSSCPPANAFAGFAAQQPDTLVLSYGVTYWDYLGWKDTFAAPEFTERQKAYGRAFGSTNVYTPQLILNGSAHSSNYSERDVLSMNLPLERPQISVTHENGTLTATRDAKDGALNALAMVVEYVSGPQSVSVDKGENHGRVLTLTNVVTHVTPLGLWGNDPVLQTRFSLKDGKSYALLLHDPKSLKLINALRLSD